MKIWTFKENKLINNNIPEDNLNDDENNQEQNESNSKEDSEEQINNSTNNENNVDNSEVTNNELDKKIELLKRFKEVIQTYAETKEENIDETLNFDDIPKFENRTISDGYSFESSLKNGIIPDSTIRTLINKFLNQRFIESSDLNSRTSSLEKTDGFYKWDVKNVAIHLESEQVTKVLKDKYGYSYASGKIEDIPLSFYFDMSGSMSHYSHILSTIALELLKKDIKILIGYNYTIGIQIDSISKKISVDEFEKMIVGSYSFDVNNSFFQKNSNFQIKAVNQSIDEYLRQHNAKKCVAFSDNDALSNIIKLSEFVDTYYLYFQNYPTLNSTKKFKGFFYQICNTQDLLNCLIRISKDKYGEVTYLGNQRVLSKERR